MNDNLGIPFDPPQLSLKVTCFMVQSMGASSLRKEQTSTDCLKGVSLNLGHAFSGHKQIIRFNS